jgi:hypothetical protein
MEEIGVNVKLMSDYGLTPNEAFYLKMLNDGSESIIGNMVNREYLQNIGVINNDDNITEKGRKFINEIFFDTNKPYVPPSTKEIVDLCTQFRDFFPKGVKTNNHPVRGNLTNIIRKMRKFKREFPNYTDETILTATKQYVAGKAKEGYAFMKVAEYLIYKDNNSTLASLCDAMIEDGGEKDRIKWGRHI